MWARKLLANHDIKHVAPLFHLLHPHLPLHLPHLPHHLHYSTSPSTLDPSPQFAYYEILQVPRHATQSQIKAAFYERSKEHHPDVAGEGAVARDNFAAILLAYTTLRDHSARYHYDLHGYPEDRLLERQQEEESIYSWEPKYGVYSETMTVDGETTELEDWFIAQGHVKKPSIWQRFSNGWVEFKFGMEYYNFPWELRLLLLGILAWAVVALAIREGLLLAVKYSKARKPIPINDRWENDDQYDILWYAGVRRNKGDSSRLAFSTTSSGRAPLPSERERERAWRRRHHLPEPRPRPASQYSHTLYSNTRSRTKKKNKARHEKFLEERREERERVARWKEETRGAHKGKKRKRSVEDGFTVEEGEKNRMVGTVAEVGEEERSRGRGGS